MVVGGRRGAFIVPEKGNNVVEAQQLLFHLWAYFILAGVGLVACLAFALDGDLGRRLLPLPGRPRGAWRGGEVFLIFVCFVSIGSLVLFLFRGLGLYEAVYGERPSPERQQLWVPVLALPLSLAALFLILFLVSGTRPAHFGMTQTRFIPNLVAGYFLWLILTPLVLAVFFYILEWMPYDEHPLSKITQQNLLAVEWLLWIFQGVVAAPLLEELLFRGVLLGWLRRATLPGHLVVAGVAFLFCGLAAIKPLMPDVEVDVPIHFKPTEVKWGPVVFAVVLIPAYLIPAGLFFSRRRGVLTGNREDQEKRMPATTSLETGIQSAESPITSSVSLSPGKSVTPKILAVPQSRVDQFREAFGPICGSSLLFAAFHAEIWPSPIPLFLFALGLGWLAYRSNSLVGPIVVHVLFNAVACIVIMFYTEPANGRAATSADRPSLSGSMVTTVPGSQQPRRR